MRLGPALQIIATGALVIAMYILIGFMVLKLSLAIANAADNRFLSFNVCQALPHEQQGPFDVNGFPVDGVKLDKSTCRDEVVEMVKPGDPDATVDLSEPEVCNRLAMSETPHWEQMHPGWFVVRVRCPHPDGSFPSNQGV